MPATFYILYSKELDRYYIGSTQDINIRLKEHLWKHKGFTSKAKDWKVVYEETFETKKKLMLGKRDVKRKESRKYL